MPPAARAWQGAEMSFSSRLFTLVPSKCTEARERNKGL